MSDLPEPLVPADVDLRDFPFMPIDIVRLFGSDFHAQSSDAEWRAGVTLWLRSYHQVPASSLPDDEVALTRLAELGRDIKSWRKIAPGALRGWTKCSDGRLYHRTVSEKALEGWIEKLLQRKSSAAGNAKRYGHAFDAASFDAAIEKTLTLLSALNPQSRVLAKRSGKAADRPPAGNADGSAGGSPGEPPIGSPAGSAGGTPTNLPHHSQETGTETRKERNARDARAAFESEFWPKYPNKAGRPVALRAWEKLWREMGGVMAPVLCGLERYIRDKPADRPWLNPATFLNQRRFEDQPASSTSAASSASTSLMPRIDFGGGVLWPEQSVVDTLRRWRSDPTTWPADRIGPPPGSPGCKVPDDLLRRAA